MKAERWEKMVKQLQPFCCSDDPEAINPVIFADDAVTLLRRQHAEVVEIVKGLMPRTTVGAHNYARKEALLAVLAALAKEPKP